MFNALTKKCLICTSGDLGGLGGRSPKDLRWGTAHASFPQYFERYMYCYSM